MKNFIGIASLALGCWMVLNGLLHDFFVLRSDHGKQYDRDLLRLLTDGHVLLTCGVMQIIAWTGLRNNEPWGYYIAATACISLLIYCAMIFPFLKSIGTITLNTGMLIYLIIRYLQR